MRAHLLAYGIKIGVLLILHPVDLDVHKDRKLNLQEFSL